MILFRFILILFIAMLALGCHAPRMIVNVQGEAPARNYGKQVLAFTVPQYSVVAFRPNPDDDTYDNVADAEQREQMTQLIEFFGGAITSECPIMTIEDEAGYVEDARDAVNQKPKVRKVAQGHVRFENRTGPYIFHNRPDDRKKPFGLIVSNGIDEPRIFWGTRGYLLRVKRTFNIDSYAAFRDSVLAREADTRFDAVIPEVSVQKQLDDRVEQSLTIIEHQRRGEQVRVDTLLASMDSLIRCGAVVGEHQLLKLVERDGGGWSIATHPEVLKHLLNNYLNGPDSREDKVYLLNQLLCRAILISDPGIVELLINAGANPRKQDIWEILYHITPDYFPSYETMRLLVDELAFDLYRYCRVTPLWWLIYERSQLPERRDSQVLAEEIRKRKHDADKVCNVETGGSYFLDPEIFPADLTAWELAERFGDEEVLAYRTFSQSPATVPE
ncbi:hypothetical protein [Parapedobacter tibetensis]|uniref:hypothetical protein n=1 Tax=Parapedobacter tibetensis TaxID=2972951 RepID=UPI00214DA7BC|nr:hypothetical protein [Parapedobacter tibetensis]